MWVFMTTIMYIVKRPERPVEAEMRVSREQVAENRQKILDAAGRLFRARGYDAVSVAEVMQAAGLTHGGFYGYFASKDELIAETLAHMLAGDAMKGGQHDLGEFASRYLVASHRAN